MADYNYSITGLDNSELATTVAYGTSSTALTSNLGVTMSPSTSAISSINLDVYLSGIDTGYFSAVSASVALPAVDVLNGASINISTIFNNDWLHSGLETYNVAFVASASGPELDALANPLSSVSGAAEFFDTAVTLSALGDAGAPSGVTSFRAEAGQLAVALRWTNPTDSDLSAVRINYATGIVAPADETAGTQLYEGLGTSTTQTTLTAGSAMAYSIFSLDNVGNWSSLTTTTSATATPFARNSYGVNWGTFMTDAEIRRQLYVEGII